MKTLILLVALSACAPRGTRGLEPKDWDVVVETVEMWEQFDHESLPPVDAGCWARLENTGIYVASTQEEVLASTGECGYSGDGKPLPGICPPGVTHWLYGQYRYGNLNREDLIVLTTGWTTDTLRHELVHEIGGCVGLGSDPEHTRSYWGTPLAPL